MAHRKKHKKGDKRTAQKLHAYRRLEQRFGITINKAEYEALVSQIRCGQTDGIRETLRVAHHRMTVKGIDLVAVYDKQRLSIVTFIPVHWSEKKLGQTYPDKVEALVEKKIEEQKRDAKRQQRVKDDNDYLQELIGGK